MYKVAFLVALAVPAVCLADTVIFKNGQELEGKVLEQDEESLLLQVEYGTLRISKDKVERVDPDTPEKLAKREFERKATETAAAKQPVGTDSAQAQIKAKLAEAAKQAQAKAKAKAAATAQKTAQQTAQQNQPSWADQYIQFRRTMHNGDTQGKNTINSSRTRMDRQSLLTGDSRNVTRQGNTNQGNSRQGNTARSRTPVDTNQLPSAARKYLEGR